MAVELYPFPLSWRAVYPLWGGEDWTALTGRPAPELRGAGELWLNDDRPGGSRVLAGQSAGLGLDELIAAAPGEVLGPLWAAERRFPLLLKFLKPDQWLSVQVHPEAGPDKTKYEAWHILQADPGAEIVLGLKPNLGLRDLKTAAESGRLPDILNFCPIAAGENYFVPPGAVHALGPGLLLFEIQQNNDVTYRFYDWDRTDRHGRPRKLHLSEALETVRLEFDPGRAIEPLAAPIRGGRRLFLAAGRFFLLCRLELEAGFSGHTEGRRFILLTGLSGRGLVLGNGVETKIGPGETVLIPAGLGRFEIMPQERLILLESSTPDLARDVVAPLRAAGFNDEAIASLAGECGLKELGPALGGDLS